MSYPHPIRRMSQTYMQTSAALHGGYGGDKRNCFQGIPTFWQFYCVHGMVLA